MRGLNPLPAARRRGQTVAPAKASERLPDAASFYEPPRALGDSPRGDFHARNAEDRILWQSEVVTRIGHKE